MLSSHNSRWASEIRTLLLIIRNELNEEINNENRFYPVKCICVFHLRSLFCVIGLSYFFVVVQFEWMGSDSENKLQKRELNKSKLVQKLGLRHITLVQATTTTKTFSSWHCMQLCIICLYITTDRCNFILLFFLLIFH